MQDQEVASYFIKKNYINFCYFFQKIYRKSLHSTNESTSLPVLILSLKQCMFLYKKQSKFQLIMQMEQPILQQFNVCSQIDITIVITSFQINIKPCSSPRPVLLIPPRTLYASACHASTLTAYILTPVSSVQLAYNNKKFITLHQCCNH